MDYISEAEALSDIYDGCEIYSEPYTNEDKAEYVQAKGRCFSKSEIGKYIVVQNSRRNKKVMPTMYLVDRNITKRMWWSPSAFLAMVFEKKSAAEIQAKKYKYNNVRVKQITPAMADRKYFEDTYNEYL